MRGDRRKGRINVMGCLRATDKRRINFFVETGCGESFYESLKSFYALVIQEWVEQGNSEEDFLGKGPKIVIILDNASFHKRKDITQLVNAEMPKIFLDYLPEYSPDYNLIELVWHSAKEYIANKLFESISELESILHRLLNEGELIINWGRKIKNKGNQVY